MTANTIDRLAVMFTALHGLEDIASRDGEAASVDLQQRCAEHLGRIAAECEGEVVDVVGGELLTVFPSPDAALNAACRMVKEVHQGQILSDPALGLSAGLHFGVVYRKDARVFGDSVNTAARVKGQSRPGQILLSDALRLSLHQTSQELVSPFDRVEVKGKAEALKLFEAAWAPADLNRTSVMAKMIDTGYLKDLSATVLSLRCGDETRQISSAMAPVTLGRGTQCDVPLDCPSASRLHCRIEHRRGKFVLVDSSTNGTQLMRSDGSTVVLRREQAVLTGHGRFALGSEPVSGTPCTLDFECD